MHGDSDSDESDDESDEDEDVVEEAGDEAPAAGGGGVKFAEPVALRRGSMLAGVVLPPKPGKKKKKGILKSSLKSMRNALS